MKQTVFLGMTLGEGSVSDYFKMIAKEFVSKGYRVVIFTDQQQYNLISTEGDLHILTWPSTRPIHLIDAQFFYKQVKYYKPSVIISNFGSVNMMTFLGFILRVPIRIVWVHTLSTQLSKASFLLKLRKEIIYRFATQLITNSIAMKEDIVNYYNIRSDTVEVFANALDIKDIKKVEKKDKTIVYAGRLHFTKGVDILLDAFAEALKVKNDLQLEIIGSGEEEENLLKIVKKHEIESNVSFLGTVSKEKVLEHFSSASFVVVPSRSEAFGYVVIEAMSVKTAVIGSNVGGIKEILADERDGLLFEVEDVETLKNKILELINSPEKLKKFSASAYEKVKEKYSNKKIASDFVKYIKNKEKK